MENRPQAQIGKGLPAVLPEEKERLLTDLLRGVSRAFYLTVRVLPRGLREPIGLAYLLAVPVRCHRLRLALAWPLLMGLATLALVARDPQWLDPLRPAKVGRRWVYRMMAASYPAMLSDKAVSAWARRLRRRVERALEERQAGGER